MIEGLRRLYSSDFNVMSQEQPDDMPEVTIVTLFKEGENKSYRFKVKDLYGEHEEVLEHEVIPAGPPQWVLDRMEEAKAHGPKD